MMTGRKFLIIGAVSAVALAGTFAFAQDKPAKPEHAGKADKPAAAKPDKGKERDMPAGMNAADMQACMEAGTPGEVHAKMQKSVGKWTGKNKMWMSPEGGEPMVSDCTCEMKMVMDGRYLQSEMLGDMGEMGKFVGQGLAGYDNVSKKYVGSWIDNHSTGIMTGEGEMSKDGKVMTWTYTMNCPITKKPTTMREVDTMHDDNTMTLEMYCKDPHSGKEYKCMQIDMKRS